jgi:hypothetical protein
MKVTLVRVYAVCPVDSSSNILIKLKVKFRAYKAECKVMDPPGIICLLQFGKIMSRNMCLNRLQG